ncbi:MAG TPA: helix-turn-helix domain-containing protein, partial [Candidatus Paceibacterota bacterium]
MSESKKIISKNGETMLSARKAAKRLSCAPDYVGKLCREGKLEGERVDNAWFIKESSIVAFERARTEARVLRSQELAEERQKEQETYRKNNNLSSPTFPTKTHAASFLHIAAGKATAFALGGTLLFASLVFAGGAKGTLTPQSNPPASSFFSNADTQSAAVLASVQSPFFSNPPQSPIETSASGNNFFASVLAFLSGGNSSTSGVGVSAQQVAPQSSISVPLPTPVPVKVVAQQAPATP